MDEIDLQQCPMCGGEVKLDTQHEGEMMVYYIQCNSCDSLFVHDRGEKEDTIQWWNERRPLEEYKEAIEEELLRMIKLVNDKLKEMDRLKCMIAAEYISEEIL